MKMPDVSHYTKEGNIHSDHHLLLSFSPLEDYPYSFPVDAIPHSK